MKNNIAFDLDEEYLINLWEIQQGKCFYSNLPMGVKDFIDYKIQNNLAPSLDKKIPQLGYTKGNVVWCCYCVNCFKSTMTDTEFNTLVKSIKWNSWIDE